MPTPVAPRLSIAEQTRLDRQLIAAARDNHLRRARSLIGRGADVNAKDDTARSAYLIATGEGFLELLDLTLTHGAGSVALAEALLSAQPDLTIRNRFGGTSLIPASERGHLDYVRWVVKTGTDVNHVNDLGCTALLEAVILGDTQRYQNIVTYALPSTFSWRDAGCVAAGLLLLALPVGLSR